MTNYYFALIVGIVIIVGVSLGVVYLSDPSPKIQEHRELTDSGLDYGCRGTASEIKNCHMINQKLDLILEKLDSQTTESQSGNPRTEDEN